MALVRPDIFHHIERDRILHVKGRKIKHIFNPLFRHILKQKFSRFAVRVNKSHAFTISNILNSHVLKQG